MTFRPADKAAMLTELARDGTTVDLEPGSTWNVAGRLAIGEGTDLQGNGATLIAPGGMATLAVDHPSVTVRNLTAWGAIDMRIFAGNLTVEDVVISHSLDGSTILELGHNGAPTAAFMVWGRGGQTLGNLNFVRCIAALTWHHGFSMNLNNANEGGGYSDVLFDQCQALTCGKADRLPRDGKTTPIDYENWACCFNIPDAGDIARMLVRDCIAKDPVQDCYHLDGSWDGHRMNITDVEFLRCYGYGAGQRCNSGSVEKFWHGIYAPHARVINCTTENCRHAGIAMINEVSDAVQVRGCVDIGSAYGMILNYAAFGADVQLVSKGAKVRAFVGQAGAGGGTLDLTVLDFAGTGPAVTFGRALRADYIDCPNHQTGSGGQSQKYDSFGYTLDGSKITIRYIDRLPIYEVWQTSHLTGSPAFVKIEAVPETPTDPPVIVPDEPDPPVTEGNDTTTPPVPVIADPVTIKYEDFALLVYEGDARLETFFVRDENRRLFRGGQVFRVVE